MRATSRTVASLFAVVGAALAASAATGAPTALAQPGDIVCEPGQVVIDGQCSIPTTGIPNTGNNVPAPPYGGGTGSGMGGEHGGGYGH